MLPQRVSQADSTTVDPTASRQRWSARMDPPGDPSPPSWVAMRDASSPPGAPDAEEAPRKKRDRARRGLTDCSVWALSCSCWTNQWNPATAAKAAGKLIHVDRLVTACAYSCSGCDLLEEQTGEITGRNVHHV
jgi:hypothetical protein